MNVDKDKLVEVVKEVAVDVLKRVAYGTINAAVLAFVTRKVNEVFEKNDKK
jgi:hypothetical protein